MKYIRDGKVIETTERLYEMVYRGIGYVPVEAEVIEEEVIEEVEEEVIEEVEEEVADLEELTVKELKEKAEALKLENYNGLKKDELIALIKGE